MYVDDILMEMSDNIVFGKLKETLNDEFDMKDLGDSKRILKMDIMKKCKISELFLSNMIIEESSGMI